MISSTSKQLELRPPAPIPQVTEQEATSSFSAMTRASHLTYKARQGRDQSDLDVMLDGTKLVSSVGSERCVLADFPRGAQPGEALHSAFEFSPFSPDEFNRRQLVIEEQLTRHGISLAQVQVAKRAIEDVLLTEFKGHNCQSSICLQLISSRDSMSEMDFNLPVGAGNMRLTVERLYEVLKSGGFSKRYLDSLRTLQFEAYAGFLRGFIDLVYMHEDKIYALDYKSNYLGECYADYGADALL